VIPVARISTGFGFGGGAGQGPVEGGVSQGGGSGGGSGGKISAIPVGYIEVTPEASKFIPIQDTTASAVRAVTLFGIAGIILAFGLMQKLRAGGRSG
ncbi:MAG: spore germination protein GerW family protein, partial [Chloroflexota bacterium]